MLPSGPSDPASTQRGAKPRVWQYFYFGDLIIELLPKRTKYTKQIIRPLGKKKNSFIEQRIDFERISTAKSWDSQ